MDTDTTKLWKLYESARASAKPQGNATLYWDLIAEEIRTTRRFIMDTDTTKLWKLYVKARTSADPQGNATLFWELLAEEIRTLEKKPDLSQED